MDEKITIDSLVETLQKSVEEKIPLSPGEFLDYATKINTLMFSLDDELVEAEMKVNELTSGLIQDGETATASKLKVKGTDQYRTYLRLKAKKERVIELIRLAKRRADLPNWDT